MDYGQESMLTSTVRRPAVSGYYYPADPRTLRETIRSLTRVQDGHEQHTALGMVVPHGSFRHAGSVLGSTFAGLAIPRRCIIVAPSHTGSWRPWSLPSAGAYRTPLGDVPIDTACVEALRTRCPFLDEDPTLQHGEHAIEVVLPFLQQGGPPELTIVPLLGASTDAEQWAQVSAALAQVIRMQEEPALLIASSDLSHYESRERAMACDRALLDAMGSLEADAFLRAVDQHHVLMCGALAVACVLDAARALGATRATLHAYGTSAEGGGDPHAVVGYAGVRIE